MDDADGLVGLAFAVAALLSWWAWYVTVFSLNKLAVRVGIRVALIVAPPAFLLLLWEFLRHTAARGVRQSAFYIALYLVIGAGWLGIATQIFRLLGISLRDDALERHNPAALFAGLGAQTGVLLCFVGGNIGEGPGAYVVLLSAGVATASLFLLWLGVEVSTGVSERITVVRDRGAGLRLAGLLVADGLILGSAAAGDWIPQRFVRDFAVYAWPAVFLTVGAIGIEKLLSDVSSTVKSACAAIFYVGFAIFYVGSRGYL